MNAPSGTVTFLFTDIEGSTERWARDRAAMQAALRVHDRLMREAITANSGHVFKTIGDAFCAAFATPESATGAALDAQRALAATDFSAVDGLRVRMALNTGTADERDDDYFGPTLNLVARLLPLGHGGQVLLSTVTAGLLDENLPSPATLADMGEFALKGIEGHERVYQLVAPDLQRDFPPLRSQKALQPWLVPEALRTRYFTGRDDLLDQLRQALMDRHRAALSGLGGVGKSQTAIEYAVRYRADYPRGVLWASAETVTALTSGFVEIAKALRLPAADSNDQDVAVKAAQAWLNQNDGWLLILDNVDDRRELRPFVPEGDKGDVLITSRESVFPEFGIPRALAVRDLEAEDAVRFLLARTGREATDSGDRAAAAELATELGNLPLALEQAAAYIIETDASFSAYLTAFRKRRVSLLEKAGGLVAHATVAVTWVANFEAVQRASRAAADVLRVSALLAPDEIPFEFFLDGAQALGGAIAEELADPDELSLAEVLRPLTRYSLVRSDAAGRVFSVHRLVQEIAWTALSEAERRTYIERAILALDAAFPNGEFATWERCERLIAHVTSLSKQLDFYDVQPEITARVMNRAGRYLKGRGRYVEARALHERALATCERHLGPDHVQLARSLNDLANVLDNEARCAEAQALYERALAIRERALGPDHPDVAFSLSNLANVHREVGRYAESQRLLERAVTILEGALGPDHADVAVGLGNLALTLSAQGRYAEAHVLEQRALAIRERTLGPDHFETANSLLNIGHILENQGYLVEAQGPTERAVAIFEKSLGPDHPLVARGLDNLGEIHSELGRYAEALTLHERAIGIRQRTFGSDHPDIANSLAGLANAHDRLGDRGVAQRLYERALAIRERSLGPDHPRLVHLLIRLGRLHREQGHTAEAIALYERALGIADQTSAADDAELAEVRRSIDALRSAV
jgi:class 3 adenylate cyclase/tetratricopeptide (TPR) repeat protein